MKNYTAQLNELRIHELRDLARKMGVHSPTTLKKEEIISEILELLSGTKAPYVKTSKQGRPPRNQDKSLSFTDIFTEDEKSELPTAETQYPKFDDAFPYYLAQPKASYGIGEHDGPEKTVSGCLEIRANYGVVHVNGCLQSDKDYLIPKNVVEENNLKNGQMVIGKIYCKQNTPNMFMHDVKSEKMPEFDLDDVKPNNLTKEINLTDLKILNVMLGGRYYFENVNPQKTYELSANLCNSLQKQNKYKVKYVCLNALNELVKDLNENIETLILPFNNTPEHTIQTVELFIDKCKREVETGNHVVIVFQNFMELIKYYNVTLNNSLFTNVLYNTLVKVKNLLFNAKFVNEKSSLTLLTCESNNYPPAVKDCVNYELLPLFNGTFK